MIAAAVNREAVPGVALGESGESAAAAGVAFASAAAAAGGSVNARVFGLAACMVLAAVAACTGEDQPVGESMGGASEATEVESAATSSEVSTVLLSVATDPTISFSLSFGVGSQNDPPGKEGLAYLTGQMLADASTQIRSYEEILEALFPIASTYQVRVDREITTLTGRTHRDNIDLFFELYSDAYLRPAFDPDDFERIRSDAVNYLENTLRFASDEELGKAALNEFVFAGTSYAHPTIGTVEGLQSITLEDVRGFYQALFHPDNVTPGLGGGFDGELTARLEASLAGLPGGPATGEGSVDAAESASADSSVASDAIAEQGLTAEHSATAVFTVGSSVSIDPPALDGREVLLVSKPDADASISFGFPHRPEPRRTGFLRPVGRKLLARRASQPVEPPVQGHPRDPRPQLRRLLLHRGLPGGRGPQHAARKRAPATPVLRSLDPHAPKPTGALRPASRHPRA